MHERGQHTQYGARPGATGATRRWVGGVVAAAFVMLAAAWSPASRRERSHATGASGVAAPTAVTGVYVLAKATGVKPPIAFTLDAPVGTISGKINGARVVLAADSSYTDDVVVRWEKTPMLPIPGIQAGSEPQVVHGAGKYTVQGTQVVLQPQDFISRELIHSIEARAAEQTLTLTGASGGIAGAHVVLDAEFTRVR